jgi:Holliday junction resolvase RusA-like endonuclease
MPQIQMKPLSVNQVWQGRRFKTRAYDLYEKSVMYLLPKLEIPEGKLQIDFEFGFSSKQADLDNGVKPFLDILQKKYGFNDSKIYKATLLKTVVKKGEEFIKFEIKTLEI